MRISYWSSDVCSSDLVIGVLHCARDERVLGNFQEYAFLARLLAHVGQLGDRQPHVLRGNQRVRGTRDLGQFGNDFLLLGQIESHCITSEAGIGDSGFGIRPDNSRTSKPASWSRRFRHRPKTRSEEHKSELQSLMRISYAVFCLKKKKQ